MSRFHHLPESLAVSAALASAISLAAPVVPGEYTDPSNLRAETERRAGNAYVAPAHLRFPYVATYYVEPTVTTKDGVAISFYVTDWDHSRVRFLDDSFRFTVRCKCVGPDGKAYEKELQNVPSGDGAFEFGCLPKGEYDVCVWAVDAKGIESHRVWHKFQVVDPADVTLPKDRIHAVTAADLSAYGIRNDGDLGRKVLVEIPEPPKGTKGDEAIRLARAALDAYAATNPPPARKGAPGYTVLVAAHGGKPVFGSWQKSRIVTDAGYDTNAVERAAVATAEGLQRLLDDKATNGFRKVVLAPGTYRVSASRKIRIPDGMTLDLNGATIKENAFTGSHALIVSLENVRDAHLVNGILEGDYYEHDYAGSPNDSEWPMGFGIDGDAAYCTVEDVVVRDITGYGAGNGMGRVDGSLQVFYEAFGGYAAGGLDPKTGMVNASEEGRCTSGFREITKAMKEAGRVQVSAYLGYQSIRGNAWQMTGCWYDAEKNFLSSETLFQYRVVPIPEGAAFLRISVAIPDAETAQKAGIVATLFHIPQNCAVRRCTFDRCRCVGYAASAMKNMLFEENLFTHSGEALAKCAFDAEDGWDMMQDVTFRGNRCVENPLNNSLLTCAGHNFVFERNKGSIYLWPRTFSPCVRDNEIDVGTFHCGARHRSGYARFERNKYKFALEAPAEYGQYRGWELAFPDLGTSNADESKPFSIRLGCAARIAGGVFTNRTIAIPEVFGGSFGNCLVERLEAGRWTGATVEGGKFYVLRQTNLFERCTFRGVEFATFGGGEQTFHNCEFTDCKFYSFSSAVVRFVECPFTGCTFDSGYWTSPSDIVFKDCRIDVADTSFYKTGSYAVGKILLDKCRVTSANGKCEVVVDLFDYRPSSGDATPGAVEVRGCTFGEGVKTAVGCSTVRWNGYMSVDADPTKKLSFSFADNQLAPGVVELGELPRKRK
jgi:hypothetical protein